MCGDARMSSLIMIMGFICLGVLLFGLVIGFAFLICGLLSNQKYEKIGAVLLSVVLISTSILGAFILVSITHYDEEIIDSTPVEVIALPSSSVEIISVDNKISEVRIIESLTNAVEVRSYTNVKLTAIPNELTTLSLEKQHVCYKFLGLNLIDFRRDVAILS